MPARTFAKVFWSGGSQAVRLPKALRLPGSEVAIERRGAGVLLMPLPERDNWGGFWDRLLPLRQKVRRGKTRAADKRRPL